MSERIKYINTSEFEDEVLRGGRVALDFYSTECPPCEALAAKFEPLSEIYGDDVKFLKIFRQENRALAEKLGVTSSPTLLFFSNGTEAAGRLNGGIKRSEIVAGIESMIPAERAAELRKKISPVVTECDVLILGGGPAGITAGIYSAQARLSTILADTALPGGQVTTTHLVSNYPGFIKPVEGFMLTHFMNEQAKEAGVVFRSAVDISDVDLEGKTILVDGYETIKARKLIIATGSSYRELGIPGEKEYKGNGVSYCATCDAKYYGGKHVVVIGGGNSAVEESLFITKFASRVTIVHQFDRLQANKEAQEKALANSRIDYIFEHEPRSFKKQPDGTMLIEIENLRNGSLHEIKADGVFIFAGMRPNTDLFKGNIKTDEHGYIITDQLMKTDIPGVYAAGDVIRKPYRQITTSVSDGTIAAITAEREMDSL